MAYGSLAGLEQKKQKKRGGVGRNSTATHPPSSRTPFQNSDKLRNRATKRRRGLKCLRLNPQLARIRNMGRRVPGENWGGMMGALHDPQAPLAPHIGNFLTLKSQVQLRIL